MRGLKPSKSISLGVALLAGSVTCASADAPWTGPYVGASLGWATSDIGWVYDNNQPPLASQTSDGGTVGVHAGYQHQFGSFVLGAEIGYQSFFGDHFGATPCTNAAFNCEAKIDDVLTVGGRLGWAVSDQFMVYGTGGYARGDISTQERRVATGVVNPFSTNDHHDGWFVGGGVDFAITQNLILGLEYRRIDFGNEFHNPFGLGNTENRTIDAESDEVRARLTFLLGRASEPAPLK